MTATEVRAPGPAAVQAALRTAVESLPASVRSIAGYHFGWLDEHGSPAAAPAGKAIRPAFVLAAASAVRPAADPAAADPTPAAVAVELVHNFSLLHDDVMDGDVTRRHRPTVWAVFGVGPAILTGDALLTLALDMLGEHRAAERLLAAAVHDLVEGQLADLDFEQNGAVALADCLAMANGKTGALVGCSVALGALLGGAEPEHVQAFEVAGRDLGLAFQLVDDLLGIWGDPVVTGKPVGSDLQSRKKSVPVVAALTSGTPEGAELERLYALDRDLSPDELARAGELVESSGARAWCRERIGELVGRAGMRIKSVSPGDPSALLTLARRVAARES